VDTHLNIVACGSAAPYRDDFAFDGTTASGKNKLAILLSAVGKNKSVEVWGGDACTA
jgi:hypothetical protein